MGRVRKILRLRGTNDAALTLVAMKADDSQSFSLSQVCVLLAWADSMMKFRKNLAGPCGAPTYLPTYLPYLLMGN